MVRHLHKIQHYRNRLSNIFNGHLRDSVHIQKMFCGDGNRFSYLAERNYWEGFYNYRNKATDFDWLTSYNTIWNHLHLPRRPFKLLDVGCGISDFTPKLVSDTPHLSAAWCVDFSHSAVKHILSQKTHTTGETERKLFGIVADASRLPFREGTFDVVFDKGTTDSVLKGNDGIKAAASILSECLRVLSPDGVLVQVTDEDPDLRETLLTRISETQLHISFSVLQEGTEKEYFLYRIKQL